LKEEARRSIDVPYTIKRNEQNRRHAMAEKYQVERVTGRGEFKVVRRAGTQGWTVAVYQDVVSAAEIADILNRYAEQETE
jgi:hypothetical protein